MVESVAVIEENENGYIIWPIIVVLTCASILMAVVVRRRQKNAEVRLVTVLKQHRSADHANPVYSVGSSGTEVLVQLRTHRTVQAVVNPTYAIPMEVAGDAEATECDTYDNSGSGDGDFLSPADRKDSHYAALAGPGLGPGAGAGLGQKSNHRPNTMYVGAEYVSGISIDPSCDDIPPRGGDATADRLSANHTANLMYMPAEGVSVDPSGDVPNRGGDATADRLSGPTDMHTGGSHSAMTAVFAVPYEQDAASDGLISANHTAGVMYVTQMVDATAQSGTPEGEYLEIDDAPLCAGRHRHPTVRSPTA